MKGMKEELIKSVIMDCPLCDKEHEVKVVRIIDQALIKDEQIYCKDMMW